MPRHRKERVPSHRALRHADIPARRARLTAAVGAALAVLDDSRRNDPDAADTVQLPSPAEATALGSASPGSTGFGSTSLGSSGAVPAGSRHARGRRRRVHSRASVQLGSKQPSGSKQPPGNSAGVLRAAARGLLVTPWFAAASGFVIAASLWIYAPHAHLQFPSGSAIRTQPCYSSCSPANSQSGSGSLAASGKGRPVDTRKPHARSGTASDARKQAAVSGLTFSYYVLPSEHGTFMIKISVSGKRAIKDWQLTFVLPGDRIRQVFGADWQRTTGDSGTASGNAESTQWAGNGQGDSGQTGGDHHEYVLTFLVSGEGAVTGPRDCVYNGRSCAFTAAHSAPPNAG